MSDRLTKMRQVVASAIWAVLLGVVAAQSAVFAQDPQLSVPHSNPRIALEAGMRAPLPEELTVQQIVPVSDGVWFLVADTRSASVRPSVYFWSSAGIQSVFPAAGDPNGIVVGSLTTDPFGVAWLLTDHGVWQSENGIFQHRTEFDSLQPKAFVGGKDLWVVTSTDQLLFLPAWQPRSAQKISLPVEGVITNWTMTTLGDLQFSVRTSNGDRILQATAASDQVTELAWLESRVTAAVSVLYSDSSLNLWIGLQSGQLLRCAVSQCDTYGPEAFSAAARFLSLGEDSNKNLYLRLAGDPTQEISLPTLPHGVAQFQNLMLDQVKGAVGALAFDAAGGVWLATASTGALRLQGTDNLPWLHASDPSQRSARNTPKGAATPLSILNPIPRASTGINNFLTAKFAFLHTGRGLNNDQVSSITADSQGRLYFTTGYTNLLGGLGGSVAGSGVNRWDHRQFNIFTTANGLASKTAQSSFFDANTNTVWIGTDNGISRLNAANDTFYSPNLLPGVVVQAILRDGSGNVWAGTNIGVYRLNPTTGATLLHFTSPVPTGINNTPNALASNNVTSMAIQDDGNVIWVGTDRGGATPGQNDYVGGISRYQINTNVWTPFNLNSPGGGGQFDSNRVISIAVDASNNVWVSSFSKGVYRISGGNAGVPASYTQFQQSNGLGGNTLNVVYSIFRDPANNLWFSFGGYGDQANPQKAAVSFLAASQINSATPTFSNYNSANNQYPSNVINSIFAESASTMWFGTLGGGVFRLGCPCDEPGWPQALSGYVYTSSPVLADLEGTGKLNIVVGDQAGVVYAYRFDGTRIWSYDVRNAFPTNFPFVNNVAIQSSPSVGDVDGDGLPEVVVGVGGLAAAPPPTGLTAGTRGKGPGALLILSNTGVLKRAFYPYDISDYTALLSRQDGLPEPVFATPLLANADDDPELEIHVGAWDNFFYSVNFDGSPIFTMDNDGDGVFDEDFLGDFTPYHPADSSGFGPGWPGVDDDHNGQIDEGPIFDDDEDGLQDEDWPEFPFWAGDLIYSSAAAVDLYGTGHPNIIFGQDYSGATGSPYSRGGILRVLDSQGNEVTGFPKANLEQVVNSTPTVADLTGDGTLQIVHGSGIDLSTIQPGNPAALLVGQLVYAWRRDGSSLLPSGGTTGKFASMIVPGVAGSGGRVFASIAVGNLDKTGPELVVVTTPLVDQNGNVIDAGGNPTVAANTLGQMVYAFRADGNLLPGFPVRPFQFVLNPPILGSPVIADVNGDGFPDIVVPAGYGLITIDHNGRVLSGMGDFENLQDFASAITQESSPAIGDIDGDGILEVVWASGTSADGGTTGNGGIIHVSKLGPVNNATYDWPMFLRDGERNPIYDIFVTQPGARASGSQVIFSAQVRHGRNPIGSVAVDLSSVGGSSTQQMFDDGTHGDPIANDGTYSLTWPAQATGRYYLTVTATDTVSNPARTARGTVTYVQRGTGKTLVASTNSINFGTVGQGLDGDMHVNLMNVGGATVTLQSIVSSNPEFTVAPAKSAFSDRLYVTPSSSTQAAGYNGIGNPSTPPAIPGYAIAPGTTLSILLRVHPAFTSMGTRTSTLMVNSDGGNLTVNLTVNARVLTGRIKVTSDALGSFPVTSLAYASITLNSSSLNQVFITSTGSDPLIISNITFDNPAFSVYKPDNPVFPRTYPVNTTPGSQFFGNRYQNAAPLQIQFKPTQAGLQSGTMKLFTNDPTNPGGVVSITLSGGGAACGVSVDQPRFYVAAAPTIVIFNVIAAASCTWTLQSNVPWLNILLNPNGTNTANITLSGNRALALDIRRNASSLTRQGTVVINGTVVTVNQAGSTDPTNLRYIYVCFNNFLAREPGDAGITFFQPLLDSGSLTKTQMAYNFFGAPEFNAIERFVIGLYYGILGRDPDFYGWDFHRRDLHLGIVTQDTLVTQFLATPEYVARYGSPTNDGFVTLLFQNALGRNPSASDVAAWSTLLTNGTLTRTQVAQSFLNSPEFQTGAQARQTVFLLHATMLSRDPGTVGYTAWLGYFNSPGSSLLAAVNAFVVSPEFQAKLGPN